MGKQVKLEKISSLEEIASRIVNSHSDEGLDLLILNDVKWKIVEMNGKACTIRDEGQVPNRLLLSMQEEIIKAARVG